MGAPTDLEDLGYGRGLLRAAPAASVRRLDVVLGRPLDINRAYADYNEQMRYYLAYQRYLNGGPWAPLALHPDKSWHCKGMAIDTDDRLAVFREHGWLFEVRDEPWHGQYYTSLDKHYGEPAGGGSRPFPLPEDDVMTDAQYDALKADIATLNTQLRWVVNALGAGGAEDGIIPPERTLLRQADPTVGGTTAQRIVNLDQQVTGADGFDETTGPSLASRIITIEGNTNG